MMDGIFGHENFRNEIVWKRTSAHSDARAMGSVHDYILYYTRGDKFTFNTQFAPYDPEYVKRRYRHRDLDGRRWMDDNLGSGGLKGGGYEYEYKGVNSIWRVPRSKMEELDADNRLHFTNRGGIRIKRYLDEMRGVPVSDVWTDIPPINSQAKDRLGYPTQKPIPLLRRIIEQSSNPDDVVFDPFCGCGTTIYAAHETGRHWIGCDVAILAVRLIRDVLVSDRYQRIEGKHFEVDGVPISAEQAQDLFSRDPFQFEHWFVECVGGFPTQKTHDQGVDGRLYFETGQGLTAMALSVKGGKLRPTDVRDLRGVLEREFNTEMAGFLSLREPTPAMLKEAAKAGQYKHGNDVYDRIQFLTAWDMLEGGKELRTPSRLEAKVSTRQWALDL